MFDKRHVRLRIGGWLAVALLAATSTFGQPAFGQAMGSRRLGDPYAAQHMMLASAPSEYVPAHQRGDVRGMPLADSMGHMHSSTAYDDTHGVLMSGGEMNVGGMSGDCACGDAGCQDCGGACAPGGCGPAGCAPRHGLWGLLQSAFDRAEFYSGVTSFSSPVNRGGTGSFGYETGVNLAGPVPMDLFGIGWQLGAGGTLANLNGANFTREDRQQLFITGGFFRRVDWGLQGGLVIDYLRDEWYANAELAQLRGELSWAVPEGREFGFWFTSGTSDDVVTSTLQTGTAIPTTQTETWEVNNLYALFYRHTFCGNSQARAFAGWTGDSDGLLGADLMLPFDDRWALRSAFTYVIPSEGRFDGGNEQESWNVGLQLVYFPHCGASSCDYYRPLFNVANNGSMIVNR